MQITDGKLKLGRILGIDLYLSWYWILGALYIFQGSLGSTGIFSNAPHGPVYHGAGVLSLFGIVLLHEFGHALACRSVGGKANMIVLRPLGGVAYVQPPERPGPVLWSIAAGPLVNVVLLPVTLGAVFAARAANLDASLTDFLADLAFINIGLLVFNMLPSYPLDGGQILRALLWFICGRSLSLIITTIIGLMGAALLGLFAIYASSLWLGLLAAYMAYRSYMALRVGLTLYRMERGPHDATAQCPACGKHPPTGNYWQCNCGARFDTFATRAICPKCAARFEATACPMCGKRSPMEQWYAEMPAGIETLERPAV